MDINDIFNRMAGGQSHQPVQVPVEKIDEFINRCMVNKNLSLQDLCWELQYLLQPPEGHTTMFSIPEGAVYPVVIQRIQQRLAETEGT